MKGRVDENKRALLTVAIRSQANGEDTSIEAWIDTAFDGHFVFSRTLIERLGLEILAETEAVLADGTKVALESFISYKDWFDVFIPVQVIANEGQFPLLGTALLEDRRLLIDYTGLSVELT